MNFLSKFDFFLIFILFISGLFLEFYNNKTIENLKKLNQNKIYLQYSITVDFNYDYNFISYESLRQSHFSLFNRFFIENLKKNKILKKYYNNSNKDTYFKLEHIENSYLFNIYSNDINYKDSGLLLNIIDDFIKTKVKILMINSINELHDLLDSDGGWAKIIDNNFYYEAKYLKISIPKTTFNITDIIKYKKKDYIVSSEFPFYLTFFIFLILFFISLKLLIKNE